MSYRGQSIKSVKIIQYEKYNSYYAVILDDTRLQVDEEFFEVDKN